MSSSPFRATHYRVAVDHGTLKARPRGHEGTGYTVRLNQAVDENWSHAFRATRMEDPEFATFELDSQGASISFTCPDGGGAVAVFSILDSLDDLVSRANRNAPASLPVATPEAVPITREA
jgi:hypothetical protein